MFPRARPLDDTILAIFGAPEDPMTEVERRAREAFPDQPVIVWQGDAATFQFSYVSAASEGLLGFPASRWTEEPTFWADQVVHEEDREDAIAYCALATGRGRDHRFEYRARSADGRIVWLRDFVQVIRGPRGVPSVLRGIMFDITAEQQQRADGADTLRRASESPSRSELAA